MSEKFIVFLSFFSFFLKMSDLQAIKRSHRITGGWGGGQDGPKKDHIIFERSLTAILAIYD